MKAKVSISVPEIIPMEKIPGLVESLLIGVGGFITGLAIERIANTIRS